MARPKRPIVHRPGGKRGRDFQSEVSRTVSSKKINKGRVTNIPTVFGGKVRPVKEAIRRIHQAGGIDPENPQRGKLKSFGAPTKKNLSKGSPAIKSAIKRSASFRKARSGDILKAKLKGTSAKRKGKSSRK